MPHRPKRTEDEWFAKHEQDLIRDLRRERERLDQKLAELLQKKEMQKQKELHWMRCPKCGSELYQQQIRGIAIDFCQICDGIYFDRRELEDLLLKSQKERRFIVSWILSVPEDLDERKAESIVDALQAWRQHKDNELSWLLSQGEAQLRKDVHWMKCPKCGSNLSRQETHGVAAEHCSICRGMFIDRLELQKLFLKQTEERKNIVMRMLKAFSSQ